MLFHVIHPKLAQGLILKWNATGNSSPQTPRTMVTGEYRKTDKTGIGLELYPRRYNVVRRWWQVTTAHCRPSDVTREDPEGLKQQPALK